MKYKVIVRPEAEDDLKEAYSWYEDKRTVLGYDFLLQVDAGLNSIARNPNINPLEYKGTRKHLLKRFPYKIIYLIEKEKIIVLAGGSFRRA
jgi:mRNA-degrading endonuclease RelE of RelBE toxin-antitoxin system